VAPSIIWTLQLKGKPLYARRRLSWGSYHDGRDVGARRWWKGTLL